MPTICDLLDELKNNKLKKISLTSDISDIQSALKKLQRICTQNYSNQAFYGNDALNRKMLLDFEIAKLLSPRVLTYLFTHDPNDLTIFKRGSGKSNLRDAIYYGFSKGLYVIRIMPNNEKEYSLEAYQQQQEKFLKYTQGIIVKNILIAAGSSNIDIEEPELNHSISAEQLDRIIKTIKLLKDSHQSSKLLEVPNYSLDAIRKQSFNGLESFIKALGLDLVRLNLDTFCEKFLTCPEAMFKGWIPHLLFDRVHLEAAIEHIILIFAKNEADEKELCFGEILQIIVQKFLRTPNLYSPIVFEQLCVRFNLIEKDLQDRFLSYYNEAIGRKPNQDSKEEKCVDTFLDETKSEQYANHGSRLPYHPITSEVAKGLDEKFHPEDKQPDWGDEICKPGPKRKTLATEHLEYIVHALLSHDQSMVATKIKSSSEYLVIIDGHTFNLSKIFVAKPQFEFIALNKTQLDAYVALQKKSYTFNDNLNLHQAEKIALHKYTTEEYHSMNELLRGKVAIPSRLNICDICVAAHALYHHQIPSHSQPMILFRRDSSYKHFNNKLLTANIGFFSTSEKYNPPSITGDYVTKIHPNPKCQPYFLDISTLSLHPNECEVLYPPNTLFQYIPINSKEWMARPIYTVDNLGLETSYQHNFSISELEDIRRDHMRLKMKTKDMTLDQDEIIKELIIGKLLDVLVKAKLANNNKWCRRDITKQKEIYLNKVIDRINQFKQKNSYDEDDIQNIIRTIDDAILNNNTLVENTRMSSLGKTHNTLLAAQRLAIEVQIWLNEFKQTKTSPNEVKGSSPVLTHWRSAL